MDSMINKIASVSLAAAMIAAVLASAGCSAGTAGTLGTDDAAVVTKLTNHMTSTELAKATETSFQLLDKPWEQYISRTDNTRFTSYKDKILLGSEYGALVYGEPTFGSVPDKDYDGGAGTFDFLHMNVETGEQWHEEFEYSDLEDLKVKLRQEYDEEIANGYPSVPADQAYDNWIKLFEAVIAGDVETIDQDELSEYMDYYYAQGGAQEDTDTMYWEMDVAAVAKIADRIAEYHLYDEELDIGFVVHVTKPNSYEDGKGQTYPALVMTDAVWRFNDVPALYDEMASGEAEPQLLVTIGFEYDIDSWDNEVRGNILCDHKKEFLDFITDNLMPYLGAKYNIDYSKSTLFGHSQGGVFTHYAAFNYDRYENQPFGSYIIASPTFWTPYFTDVSDYEEYKDEYGFFERNDSYGKTLFIAAGDQEDADYQEYYGTNDSTTEGVAHLAERLDAHGVNSYTSKMYSSHHYQYVGQMLLEYVKNGV